MDMQAMLDAYRSEMFKFVVSRHPTTDLPFYVVKVWYRPWETGVWVEAASIRWNVDKSTYMLYPYYASYAAYMYEDLGDVQAVVNVLEMHALFGTPQ